MKNPESHYRGDVPYESYTEYMEELFAYMDIYLLTYIKKYMPASPEPARQSAAFLEGRLKARGLEPDQSLSAWGKMLESRRSMTMELGGVLPLEQLLEKTGGDSFVRNLLIFVLMVRLNQSYGKLLACLWENGGGYSVESGGNSDRHGAKNTGANAGAGGEAAVVTPALFVRLFLRPGTWSDIRVYMDVQKYLAVLCRIFPELRFTEDACGAALVCDERLTDLLLGLNRYLPCGTEVFVNARVEDPLIGRQEIYRQLDQLLEEDLPMLLLTGAPGAGKKHLLKHMAQDRDMSLVFYDLSEGYSDEAGVEELKRHILYAVRECQVYEHYLVLNGLELLTASDMKALAAWLEADVYPYIPGIFLVADLPEDMPLPVYTIELPELSESERIEVWNYYLQDCATEEGLTPEPLANTFLLTPGQIRLAVRHAVLFAGNRPVTEVGLYQACYVQLEHHLAKKAVRVKPSFGWADLKMAAEDKDILQDVCHCVRNRHRVLDEWGFSKIVPYGGGITVLFAGPPGTGKTMAAQVIANELHMELYKIDLSQVIDKYVGETEKNIRLIFEQAKKSSSILFFDEADSIFNKRMEASNANERFANIESSLLLQCIEEYNGITILATNHFSAIDNAFIRRFKYYLLFKEPDVAVRYEIWRSVFPEDAPLSAQVDLAELARTFEFTGAVIKNVALAAAYLAARQDREILPVDILKAVRREMAKNNLILTREKMGSLGFLFDEMMDERA